MNGTLIGSIAVIIWGISVPAVRIVEEQIGAFAFIGILFGTIGAVGLLHNKILKTPFPSKTVLLSPILWARGFFFVFHEASLYYSVFLVQKENLPFVILLNYLWPTCIILCSIAFAGVSISRWWAFIVGTSLVLYALSIELLGSTHLNSSMFGAESDRLAYALVTLGALSWGMYCALSKKHGDTTGGGGVIPIFQLILGLALPISFIPAFSVSWNLSPLGLLILIIFLISDYIAYQAWDFGMRKGNVVILSLCADFIPWFSLMSAALMLGVAIRADTILSAFLLVIGGIITRYGTLPKRINNPTTSKI